MHLRSHFAGEGVDIELAPHAGDLTKLSESADSPLLPWDGS